MLHAAGLETDIREGQMLESLWCHPCTGSFHVIAIQSLCLIPLWVRPERTMAGWREISFVSCCKIFTLYWRREGTVVTKGCIHCLVQIEPLALAQVFKHTGWPLHVGLCLPIATPGVRWDAFYFRKLFFCFEGAHHRDSLWPDTVIFWFGSLGEWDYLLTLVTCPWVWRHRPGEVKV